MRNKFIALVTTVSLTGTFAASVALAANPHLVGQKGQPVTTDEGLTLAASGKIAGLGNADT